MPEVGLTGLPLDYPHSGTAAYVRNLVPLLPDVAPDFDFRLFVRRVSPSGHGVPAQRVTTPFHRLDRGRSLWARADKFAWEEAWAPAAAAVRREAIFHSLYFAAPVVAAAPVVVTVHDLIPLAIGGYHRGRASEAYSRFMAWTVKRAHRIITVSNHSKADIVRLLGVPSRTVCVTHEAVDDRFRAAGDPEEAERLRCRYRLPERFVLYIGGAERRKNLELLVRAWAGAREAMRRLETRLVIVASFPPPDALYPDIPGLVGELNLQQDVLLAPRVAEEDLPALYRAALAFCYPSRYEGFGFPPLEAMASGTPVLASRATSLPEIVGDGGWLISADSVPEWSEALTKIVDSPRERAELAERGLRRARAFSWRSTAEQTVAVYRQVLAR